MSASFPDDAACRMPAADPDVFFPEYKVPGRGHEFEVKAKAVCRRCPVKAECLADALEQDNPWGGIRGGLTPEERRHLRADRRGRAA